MPLPSYKEITELVKLGLTIEAQAKIMELRAAALELEEENLALRKRVSELEQQIALHESVVYRAPSYWIERDGTNDGPYCQKCYDVDSKLVRLQTRMERGAWLCQACGKNFVEDSYQPPAIRQRRNISSPFAR
jgi:ribosomal protein L37AE/L43A